MEMQMKGTLRFYVTQSERPASGQEWRQVLVWQWQCALLIYCAREHRLADYCGFSKKLERGPGITVHTFNPISGKERQADLAALESSLVYIGSSRPAGATSKTLAHPPKPNKNKLRSKPRTRSTIWPSYTAPRYVHRGLYVQLERHLHIHVLSCSIHNRQEKESTNMSINR